jgi:hypothetical protein
MRQRHRAIIVTFGLLPIVLWISAAKAERITICFATAQSVCGTNNHGSDKFAHAEQLEVLHGLSDNRALEAAKTFCKAGKEIRKISNKSFSGVYQVAEFDCDRK